MGDARFADIYPDIKGIFTATCMPQDPLNQQRKQSYTARILVALSGEAAFFVDGAEYTLGAGGALYMPPHHPYTTAFRSKFIVRQICFDFFPYRHEDAPYTDILVGDAYDERYMGTPVRFSDTDVFDSLFVVDSQPALLATAMTLWKEYEERRIGYAVRTRALLAEILVSLYRAKMAVPDADSPIGDLLAYINAHCGEPLTREELAGRFHYHPNHINRLVRQATGKTLHSYICETRIRRAAEYLRDTTLSVTEIAHSLAFCDSSYFSAVFQKYTGTTPRAYRKYYRGEE